MTTPAQRHLAAALERLRQRLQTDVPSVANDTVDGLLAEARADRPRTVRELDAYLARNPNGLLAPDPRCPLGLVRLAHVLAGHGHPVLPPACPGCGRRVLLPHQGPTGRICERCHDADHPLVCTKCGRTGGPHSRFDEELLCRNCYRKDPRSHRQCSQCGRMRPVDQRSQDGEPLCQACAPRPLHTCIDCGRQRPAHALTPTGPVCAVCYPKGHQEPRRCGRCGEIGSIVVRANADQPDICQSCWSIEYGKRRRAARPPRQPRERPVPATRRPEPRPKLPRFATCCLCGRERKVMVNWPIGLVCGSCYTRSREHPAACTGCSEIRVLIAKDADGQLVCGPCSGSPLDYRCRQCGNAGRVIAAGKCYRCCVELRLHELLDGADGQIPVELTALAKAMLAAEKPRSVWVWLNRSAAAPLLELIAHQPGPPTHAILDALTPSRAVHFVRRMLIDTEVLPDRMDHLDRVDPWLDSVLETRPPAHARLVRPYAKWHLLHRGRRRANRRGDSPGSAYSLRETIHVTLDLLDWIDRRGLMLVSLNQGDVDTWLVETPGSRPYFARDFLQWAVSNRLAPKGITIPARKVGEPKTFANTQDHTEQLRRCIHDDDLPTDVRAAGILILLYGLRTVDLLSLRREQLIQRGADHYLKIGAAPLLLPPPLVSLLEQLPLHRNNNRTVLQMTGSSSLLLFPGFSNTQPRDAGGFGARLLQHGIDVRRGRNTARLTLAADLPASVLADILSIHNVTATRWARRTRRDWHLYLAQRRTGANAP